MNRFSLSRRQILQTSGTGVLAVTVAGQTATAQTDSDRVQWTFNTDNDITSSPTVVDSTVYLNGNNSLYAVNAETGAGEWDLETGYGNLSSPTVVDDTVFSGGDNLYAIDADTGDTKWVFEDDKFESSPTVIGSTVFIGGRTYSLYAVDAATGKQKWAYDTEGFVASPTVVDETVFFTNYGGVIGAVNAISGDKKWELDIGINLWSSPTVVDGTVFAGSDDGSLYAVDAATGNQQWSFETGDWIRSSPTVANGTVFVGSYNDKLHAVDSASGDQQWAFSTDSAVISSPTVVGGTVFVGSRDNNLYAVDAATGERQWAYETGSGIRSSPTVADGTIFVGSGDGNLYAVDAGVNGSSNGSRVSLGTLGHNSSWDYTDQEIEEATAELTVSIAAPAEVAPETSVTISGTVENTGNAPAEGGATLLIDGEPITSVDTIPAGENTTLECSVDTGTVGDEYNITITAGEASESSIITVTEANASAIDLSLDVPETVAPETSFNISGTVENTGDAAAEGSATLTIDEARVDSIDTISAGETTTLSGSVESGATGDSYDITLLGPNNASETTTVTVTEPDTSQLDISLDVPDTVDPNTTFDVSGTVENTGETEASGGATLSVDAETIDSTENITAGENVTLSGSVGAGEAGSSHTVLIESPDGGSETQTVSVEATEGATCTGSPTMSRTSITSPQESITNDSPAQVEANFRVDPNVPEECEVTVNLEYSFSQSGFQFSGGSGWDQSASDIVATEFAGLQSGEIRSISADIEANGANPGDEVTVVATYEVWYAGNRGDSLQQTTRETITVEGSSGGNEQGDDGSTDGTEQDEDSSTTDGDGSSVNVDVPGFGIPSTLTAIGGAGYMIKRRLSGDKEEE